MDERNTMPAWLTQPEDYTPPADKDRFVDKSILSFLGLLGRIRQQGRHEKDLLWVSPVFKILGVLLVIVLVSLSRSFPFLYGMLAVSAVLLALLPADDLKRVLKLSVAAALLTYLILLPSVLSGSRYSITMIPVKVLISLVHVGVLSYTTRWDHLIAALRRFHVPNLVIFIFDIMIKYIVMLGEYALQMLYALKLRSVGRNRHKYGSIGGVGGMLFVKSHELSREMYFAMECRGFDGEYPVNDKFRFTVYDAVYLVLLAVLVWIFILAQKAV